MNANQLRPGFVIQYEGDLWICLESVHKTPGNLRAFIQAKLRKVKDGSQKEFRFASTDDLDRVSLIERPAQFLYNEDNDYHFMDTANYEQFALSGDMLGDKRGYLLPNTEVAITFFEEKAIGVKLPTTLEFNIIEAEPNMKSATATSSYKTAKIETGVAVKVPQFIESGERIVVNTETGEYMERAKK